jgi:chemotaxis protein MotB
VAKGGKGDKRPIIVVKKIVKHGGHHGGAWKVAYADFVTAMMAFFMVMWILGMDENVKNSIQGYFANPIGYKKGYSGGKSPMSSGSSPASVKTATPIMQVNRVLEEAQLGAVGGRIRSRLKDAGLTSIGDRIEIVKTQDGLRIELAEDQTGDQFFSIASAIPTAAMRKTLEIVSGELGPLKNPIVLEGHTDAAQYAGLYSNWELSSDRANAARRVLEGAGLDPARIIQVRGMADRELRNRENPLDPRNRRITILLPFVNQLADSTVAPPLPRPSIPGTPGPNGL